AVSSAATPLDARPFAYRDMAPWLPAGAFRSRHQAVVGIDGAVPVLMSGYVRVRLRAFAAADEAAMFDDENVWRLGGEVGAVWPTVIGPIEVGAAAGQHA